MKAISRKTARAIDRFAVDKLKIPELILMENAGRNAAEILSRLITHGSKVLIVAGKGNNGGDGFVIARQLQRLDFQASVCYCGAETDAFDGPGGTNRKIWLASGGECFFFTKEKFLKAVENYQVIVDALYGTGLESAVRKEGAGIIEAMNASESPIFAIDLPSGLDCDTGKPLGICVRAVWTASFLALKKGFALEASKKYTGEVFATDIGFDMRLAEKAGD